MTEALALDVSVEGQEERFVDVAGLATEATGRRSTEALRTQQITINLNLQEEPSKAKANVVFLAARM